MSDSADATSVPDQWTDEQEKVVKSYGEEATSYSWLHHRCSQWFDRWDKVLTIFTLTLPIIVGSSLFTTYVSIQAVQFTYGGLLLVTSFVIALQAYLGWGKRSTSHQEGALQWSFCADDIQAELVLPRNSRSRGFFQKAREKRKTLLTSYPEITSRYEKLYKEKFGKLPVAKPVITDNIPEIQINTDTTDTKPATLPVELIQKENADPNIQFQIDRYIANNLNNT